MIYDLYSKYGPIISDEESEAIFSTLKEKLNNHDFIKIDFDNIVAMSTKSAKRIFGTLYSQLGPEKFYERIHITNASNTLQEIIYDAIVNFVTNN